MADNHFKINRGLSLVPQTSAPSNPANGDIYYDSTLNKFRKYQNAQWTDLDTGGSGSGAGDDLNALKYRVSFSEDFSDPLTESNTINTTAGRTDSTLYSQTNTLFQLSYDAAKTVSTSSTTATLSATPSFTVKAGDMLIAGGIAKRIATVNSQTSYVLESAFGSNLLAGTAACVSQAVHTVDLNNYAGDGLAPSAAIATTMNEVLVDYEDSTTSADTIFDIGTPHVGYSTSVDGTTYSAAQSKPSLLSTTLEPVTFTAAGSNLYLRFFANKTTGTGSVNLLGFKAYFHAQATTTNGNLLNQAYCISDGTGVEINCSVSTVALKTRIALAFTYLNGINLGTANGQLDVFINGQKIPRYVDATITPSASYTEIDSSTIQLEDDYSSLAYSIEVIKRVGVVDTSTTNTARIAALETLIRSQAKIDTYTVGNQFATTNTSVFRFSNTSENTGSAFTIAHSTTLGSTITLNEAGIFSASGSYLDQGTGSEVNITLNSTALNTSQTLAASGGQSGTQRVKHHVSAVFVGAIGDVIRLVGSGATDQSSTSSNTNGFLRIIKIGK